MAGLSLCSEAAIYGMPLLSAFTKWDGYSLQGFIHVTGQLARSSVELYYYWGFTTINNSNQLIYSILIL